MGFFVQELVTRGLDPRIHVLFCTGEAWMAGTSPTMTLGNISANH
jgi:hypothetical protein